ncbi:MAG: hypothetical protein HYX73_06650 [Acidobacteria bacterium]|nr:hypothetical protein [Acidobacteriota bacterium]
MNAVSETNVLSGRMITGEDLLRAGRSLKILAIIVIVLLSVGVGVLAIQQWMESGILQQITGPDGQAVYGFGLLMLLTVGYLVGKGWSTTRYQQTVIAQLLQEEAITRARRMDPILEFHHPDLCREILLRQANYAGRIHSGISLVEMTVADFGKFALEEQNRPVAEEFYQEMRRHCRPLDFWLRWSPNSFLLVLLEVSAEETAGVVYRLRSRLNHWWNQQTERSSPAGFEWRYRTVGTIGSSGDVLREVRSLMEPDLFVPTPIAGVWQARGESLEISKPELTEKGRSSR